jgi:death-on-curing protein
MRYLNVPEVLEIHHRVLLETGGASGILSLSAIESALAQPRMSFAGQELYRSLDEKAAAIAYALVMNHPFVDGNKRVSHAAMETFLVLNGWELKAGVDETEGIMLTLAAGELTRDELRQWIAAHAEPRV